MLLILKSTGELLENVQPGPGWTLPEHSVWIEMVDPTREEELAVEAALGGVELPTRDDMLEIETSSRLYQDNAATVMIATVLCEDNGAAPVRGPVTFVLVGGLLVTIRYIAPKSFSSLAAQAQRQPELRKNGMSVFMGLLESIIDYTADLLERTAAEVEAASLVIFAANTRGNSFKVLLNRLAQAQSINAKASESLVSLARLISYAIIAQAIDEDGRRQLRSFERDVHSLTEHAAYVSNNLTFLLDAALGFINIEQNEITKVFSIYAVILLPPTLIAGIYGMNFHFLPELSWPLGYPFACC